MDITVNGERHGLSGPVSLAAFLSALGLDPRKIAVERNLEIVPRSAYATTMLGDGDRIEVVHFIGGGLS